MSELEHNEWAGTTYGTGLMHRWLIGALRILDVRLVYLFVYIFVVPPTMVVNKRARRVIYDYFRRHRGYGLVMSWFMTYRNHCAFAEVVIDRFAMYAGKKFKVDVPDYDRFDAMMKRPEGFVQLSSHIGNYELAGYSLKAVEKPMNAIVFAGEKESVMANRNRLFAAHNIRMIPVSADMSHVFESDRALNHGEVLSMPADRMFGSKKHFALDFLGSKAPFPQGPFVMAAAHDVGLLYVAVMKKGGKRYEIEIEKIDLPAEGSIREKARQAAQKYVSILERTLERHPEQWYNYFDFWQDERSE